MNKEKFENYTTIINNERNNIMSNITMLECQISDLKSKLEYKNLMFKLIENIFKIISEKGEKNCTILIPLKLKDYFSDIFIVKEDIYTYLHTNLIQSGFSNFKLESYHQFKIKNFDSNELNKYFDTYLSIIL